MAGAEELPDEALEGVVERVVYVDSRGFTVLLLDIGDQTIVKAAGTVLVGAQPGESLRLSGRHERGAHGPQFSVRGCEHVLPASVAAMRLYLASGLIRGIGPKIAHAIVDAFGEPTMTVIDEDPEQLRKVFGIGPTRYAAILAGWQRHKDMRELMLLLQGSGVPAGFAPRIAARFAQEATDIVTLVRQEPYRLVEVEGIGFLSADQLALSLGVPERSSQRLRAGLLFALDEEIGRQGHAYLPEQVLLNKAVQALGQDRALIARELDVLREQGEVVAELVPHRGPDGIDAQRMAVFSARTHGAEDALTRHIGRLRRTRTSLSRRADWTADLRLAPDAPALHEQQEQAVRMALSEPVSILTGGPGCGKSYTVATIVALAEACGAQVTLTAPTGRAAQRLSELSGAEALTVHRLLMARPGGSGESLFDVDPLAADLFVVDEASMLDTALCARLVAKIPTGAHLVFVGDVDQLPSIGPGCVLRDLLAVRALPRTRLTHVFRQAEDSPITANAHLINQGLKPYSKGAYWFWEVPNADEIPDQVLDLATRRLPARLGLAPGGVQVLCPSRRHPELGSDALARKLQAVINPLRPGDAEHRVGERSFRLGDRVMPQRNDRSKGPNGVFNGSVGTVVSMDQEQREVEVLLDDGDTALYSFDELGDLLHSYAISVHKAQGSEYPVVVVPLSMRTAFHLRRNLLYTAVTRARRQLVLVGELDAYKMAVTTAPAVRLTGLAGRLRAHLGTGDGPPQIGGNGQIPLY